MGFSVCRSPLQTLQSVAADAHVVLRDEFYFFAAVRGGKSATLFSTHVPRQKTIKFICAVRGVKLCEAFELFCRWRHQNALLAIFH